MKKYLLMITTRVQPYYYRPLSYHEIIEAAIAAVVHPCFINLHKGQRWIILDTSNIKIIARGFIKNYSKKLEKDFFTRSFPYDK